MDQIAQQLPLLAGFMALYGSSLIVIRSLYERMVATAEKREQQAIEMGKESVRLIEQLTDRLEALEQAVREARRS